MIMRTNNQFLLTIFVKTFLLWILVSTPGTRTFANLCSVKTFAVEIKQHNFIKHERNITKVILDMMLSAFMFTPTGVTMLITRAMFQIAMKSTDCAVRMRVMKRSMWISIMPWKEQYIYVKFSTQMQYEDLTKIFYLGLPMIAWLN